MALASMNNLLAAKGVLSTEEVTSALNIAEQTILGDYHVDGLDPAQRDAVAFPGWLLRLAANGSYGREIQSFSELAKSVGQTKPGYNDQL